MLGEKYAYFNVFYNGYKRTERLWLLLDVDRQCPSRYYGLQRVDPRQSDAYWNTALPFGRNDVPCTVYTGYSESSALLC